MERWTRGFLVTLSFLLVVAGSDEEEEQERRRNIPLEAGEVETTVSCVLGRSCILSCSSDWEAEPVVQWTYWNTAGPVHAHSSHIDQDLRFQGRTSLVEDPVTGRNTSLMLELVKVQDEGTYRCYHGNHTSFIRLQVDESVQSDDVITAVVLKVVGMMGVAMGGLLLLFGLWFLHKGIVSVIQGTSHREFIYHTV